MDLPEVASIAVIHNGKTLWLQRGDNRRFTLPGGHLEPNEEPIVGAARELNEEAGIDPNGGLIYLGQDVSRGRVIHAFVLHCDECPEVNIANDPDKEAVGFHWLDELPDNPHVPHEHNVTVKLLNPLTKSETKKFWKSKDGAVKIPHHTNPDRKEWDKRYYDSLVQHFGYGDPSRLQPVEIPVTPNISGTNAVKDKARHSLYVRMLRGGDTVPPLVVRRNNLSWYVLDGNHRLDAALNAGVKTLKAYEMVDPKPRGKLKKSETEEPALDHGVTHHDQDVWIEEAPYGELLKGKKDALNMYPQEIRNHPDTKAHLDWAYGKMPNENWSLWTVRHHRTAPQDFTPEVKQKIEHFAGSQHIPEIANVRFDKTHNLQQGLELLHAAEDRYVQRAKAKLNLAPKPKTAEKYLDLGNGLAWWNLGKPACEHEGKAMGHCGNVPSQEEGQHLFSLRQEHKLGDKIYYEPHLTFIRQPDEISFGEMKGRGNEKPARHYHKAIVELFKKGHLPVGGGYAPQNNFHADDLSPEDFEQVRQHNPAIAAFRSGAKSEDLHAAFDQNPAVLPHIFKHKEVDENLIRKFTKHLLENDSDDDEFRKLDTVSYLQNIARDENKTPLDVLHRLASHYDPDVVSEVTLNRNSTPEVLARVLDNAPNQQIASQIAQHPKITPEIANKLYEKALSEENNPSYLNLAILTFMNLAENSSLRDSELIARLASNPKRSVRAHLAGREGPLPAEIIHKLSHDQDGVVRFGIAKRRQGVTPEIIERLSNDSHDPVRAALGHREDLPPEIANKLILDPSGTVRMSVIDNPALTSDALGKLMDQYPHGSMAEIARHPNLTEELALRLINHPDFNANIGIHLAERKGLPESVKEALWDKSGKAVFIDQHYIRNALQMHHPLFYAKKSNQKQLEKGLKEVALAGALALGGGAAAQDSAVQKPNPDLLAAVKRVGVPTTEEGPGKWHTQGLHQDLIPIAHLESSFGKNMNHAKGRGGDYDTAYGAVGLKPMTAHEEYLRTPTLQKLYGDLKDPAEFTKKFKSDWQFYNLVASAHFARLKRLHGSPEKAAYAWRWGHGAASGATDEQVANEIYVQKYKNLALNAGVKKFEPLNKGKISQPDYTFAWGASHRGSKDITHLSAKMMGIPGFDEYKGTQNKGAMFKKSEDLDKMAIRDIPPGQRQTPKSTKYMYDHVLRPEHRAEQYHVVLQDLPIPKSRQPSPNEKHYLRALLYHYRKQVGEVNSTLEGDALNPQWTKVDKEHRGKQLGLALYEATYAHALHHYKVKRVLGGEHSTAAHYLHQQLSAKHGMKYEAELNPDRGLRDRGDFDSRYEPYEYAMKNELQKSAAKLVSKIVPHLTDDLRRPPWKGSDNCLAGHCYVASEALWHLMGGPESGYIPQSIQHEGGPHWYLKHKVTGEIIDPTAGQFKTPVPYEKGVGKGFLTKQPSKRAQVVIDRVAGKLNKMAIRDLKPQRSAVQEGLGVHSTNPTSGPDTNPLEHFPGQVFNYTHYLPEELQNNLRLSVVTDPETGRVAALVHSPDTRFDEGYGKNIHQEYGRVTGGIYPKSKRLEIGYSFLQKPFRGKGIGLAAYEAIYAHVFHHHKVREVIGLDHSTAAHSLHKSLANKHGLEYHAENHMHWKPSKDFDGKYAPYRYTLKAELQKMAIKDIKGKPIEGEHGLVQLDFSHLLHPEIAKTHKLFTRHYGWEGVPTDHVAVRLVHRESGDRAGKIDAGVEGRAISPIDVEVFDPKLRGRGVGRAMYEALYGHVYHTLGIKKVVGGTHSSMANRAHLSVTSKHKLPGYNPEQIGRIKGPRDDAFGDYEYSLISRP